MIVLLSSCKLDPSSARYTNIIIPVEERIFPETAPVNVPLIFYAYTSRPDGCWSNIHFVFEETDERSFQLFALADYEAKSACPEVLVEADTAFTITPVRPGNYIITVWNSYSTFELDTIKVGETMTDK